jgi:hypothetical protein
MNEIDETKLREIIDDVISKRIDEKIDPASWDPIGDILKIVTKLPNDVLNKNPLNVHGILNAAFTTLGNYGHDTLELVTKISSPGIKAASTLLDTGRIDNIWNLTNDYGGLEKITQLLKTYDLHHASRPFKLSSTNISTFLKTCKDTNVKLLKGAENYTGHDFDFIIDNVDRLLSEAIDVIKKFEALIPDIMIPIDLNSFSKELEKYSSDLSLNQSNASFISIWNYAAPIVIAIFDLLYHILVNTGRTSPTSLSFGIYGGASVAVEGGGKADAKVVSIGNLVYALIIGGLIRFIHQGLIAADKIVTRKIKEEEQNQLIEKIADAVMKRIELQKN